MCAHIKINDVPVKLPVDTLAWDVGYAYNGGPYSASVLIWDDEPGAREFTATHEDSAAQALLDAVALANAARLGRPA